ncbi:hypothetical protein RAS2_03710 [Phycisphaerae bacterium RAS2]|nr:hypothetical protein RAS2_03710 [Phycisphaerae bacterium RAS2]
MMKDASRCATLHMGIGDSRQRSADLALESAKIAHPMLRKLGSFAQCFQREDGAHRIETARIGSPRNL